MIICNNTAASNRFFIIHVCVDIQNAITAFKTKLFKKLKQKMVENNQQMTQKKTDKANKILLSANLCILFWWVLFF
jgi:hypothetical protein